MLNSYRIKYLAIYVLVKNKCIKIINHAIIVLQIMQNIIMLSFYWLLN